MEARERGSRGASSLPGPQVRGTGGTLPPALQGAGTRELKGAGQIAPEKSFDSRPALGVQSRANGSQVDGEAEIMSEAQVQPTAAGFTQWQRVADTFTAPSKTFEDIRRGNRSWWLPLIVLALASYILFGAVAQKVGIRQTVENQITMNPQGPGADGEGDSGTKGKGNAVLDCIYRSDVHGRARHWGCCMR